MASKKNGDQKLADQANELYWRSDQSVNQIAEAMDLSKSGLYALVRPLAAEGTCPDCGEGLVFTNRLIGPAALALSSPQKRGPRGGVERFPLSRGCREVPAFAGMTGGSRG